MGVGLITSLSTESILPDLLSVAMFGGLHVLGGLLGGAQFGSHEGRFSSSSSSISGL